MDSYVAFSFFFLSFKISINTLNTLHLSVYPSKEITNIFVITVLLL